MNINTQRQYSTKYVPSRRNTIDSAPITSLLRPNDFLGVSYSVVTGNRLLHWHIFSFSIVHVSRGEAWEEEMPGQLSILTRWVKFLEQWGCSHNTLAGVSWLLTVALAVGA